MVPISTSDPTGLAERLDPLLAEPGRSGVFCDIDGTIAPIVERAHEASVPAPQRRTLGELARRYRLCGCVSGRPAAEARRLVGVGSLWFIGNHGFEVMAPNARDPALSELVQPHAGEAQAFALEQDVRELRNARLRIEDKGAIVAFHWRGSPDEAAAEAKARELAADASDRGLESHWGRKVLEVRPKVEIDKGIALAGLLEEQGIAHAFYGGDDTTDIDVFRALRRLRDEGSLESATCVAVHSSEGPEDLFDNADAVVDGLNGFLGVLRLLAGSYAA